MNAAALELDLAALAAMSAPQLRAEWRRVLRTVPPPVSLDILQRGIAYRLQEKVHGGLATTAGRELDRMIARRVNTGATKNEVRLKPGARLVRTWQGKTYSVLVADNGFILHDRQFASLSQVAQAITGAHWSGPRFFGLAHGSRAETADA
ncbi:MAG: DUF2924 domain-containing protein [Janthinobacterium lividum]